MRRSGVRISSGPLTQVPPREASPRGVVLVETLVKLFIAFMPPSLSWYTIIYEKIIHLIVIIGTDIFSG